MTAFERFRVFGIQIYCQQDKVHITFVLNINRDHLVFRENRYIYIYIFFLEAYVERVETFFPLR